MRRPDRRVSIYDVAERAGVSISTVSLAVNAPHRVGEATRLRVLAAAAALGYRTRERAQRDAGIRVAVAAPFTAYPSYLRRFAGMLARTRGTAIELVAHDLDSAAESAQPLLEAIPASRGVDGAIVMGVPLSGGALRASRDNRLPVVLLDVRAEHPTASAPSTVVVDDVAGGRAIGEHLRRLGHRRVIFLHEPQISGTYVSAAMLRVSGLSESVAVTDAVCAGSAKPGEVAAAALRANPGATAIVAHHDGLAVPALLHLRTADPALARRTAVVGYDDGDAAEAVGLTTVRQPFEESGAVALELVSGSIAGTAGGRRDVVLEPSLIVRSSSGGALGAG